MESVDFKKIFGEVAKNHGFERAYEGWFKEFPEVIQVLDLQKSNYSNCYYLNIKIFIQGAFGNKYKKSKQLVKIDEGDIFLREPDKYSNLFNLESALDRHARIEGLNKMFEEFLIIFSKKTSSKQEIRRFHVEGNLFILPAVKEELGI